RVWVHARDVSPAHRRRPARGRGPARVPRSGRRQVEDVGPDHGGEPPAGHLVGSGDPPAAPVEVTAGQPRGPLPGGPDLPPRMTCPGAGWALPGRRALRWGDVPR